MRTQNYDIIGDIHGYADQLHELLEKLDFNLVEGVYQNPERKAVFLGDFIDRGPQQREVLQTVMPMVNRGHALAVMGNHEFNALAFHTEDPEQPGCWLRPRSDKNIQQHSRFLEEYLPKKEELDEVLRFFQRLPLWLDLDGIRVVHACWDQQILKALGNQPGLSPELLIAASDRNKPEYQALDTLLKGAEYKLPPGIYFTDKDGRKRTEVRTRWWINEACRLENAVLPPGILDKKTGSIIMEAEDFVGYDLSEKPVFIGHYWFEGVPERLAENVACLDYSVAGNGKLVAYRWSGEQTVSDENFVYVL